MNNPILSICIPTYNRDYYLIEQLNSIFSQFGNKEIYNQVEVVISSNASTDNTDKVVADYQKKFNNLRYFKNETNLGADRNIEKTIRQSQGDFIWTLSDDDFVDEFSLVYVLDMIKRYPNVSLICVDNRPSERTHEPLYYETGNEWLKHGMAGGMLSQNIFNRKYLTSDIEKYYDNLWLHYSLAMEIVVDKPVLFIKNIFKNLDNEHPCDWAKQGALFFTYVNLKKIVASWTSLGYDKETVNKLLVDFAKGLPRHVALGKLCGLKINYNNFRLLIKEFYNYPLWLFISIFVFFVPVWGLKIIRKIWKISKAKRK